MTEIEKQPLTSMDVTEYQLQKLKEIFPEVFTEGNTKPNWDKLRLTLGEDLDIGKERFGLNWHGKSDCYKVIQQPSIATLMPAKDESIDFDTTQNVFIEGDNLEVLKLLQKSYLGKVKMIYIDPPYNTGKEFIYPDNYAENLQTYLEYTGQVDSEGRKFTTNTETDGRFHSKWLNMMYPRLFLARNLLRDDGVIFISIDDHEQANLKLLCDEIFGEENFEGHIHWRRRHNQPNDKTKMIGLVAEHILAYAKNKEEYKNSGVGKVDLTASFTNPDKDHRGDWASKPWKVGAGQSGSRYIIKTPTGVEYNEEWMGEEKTFNNLVKDGRIIFPKNGSGLPRKKYYKSERQEEGQCANNWWSHEQFGSNQDGTQELESLIELQNIFENPKPIQLIRVLIQISNAQNYDLILDFFAGSATTAHSVMELNKEDGGNRKFICVQLPEPTDEDKEAFKAGYKTIAEVSKERIRRVSKKLKEGDGKNVLFDSNKAPLDLGFKVFKLQPSNFRVWDGSIAKEPEAIQAALDLHVSHLSPEAQQEAILFELLLKAGFELDTHIEKIELESKDVYSISQGELLICLDKQLNYEVIKAMAERNPTRVICLDEGFQNNDQLKTNAVQIMKTKGVVNFRTV